MYGIWRKYVDTTVSPHHITHSVVTILKKSQIYVGDAPKIRPQVAEAAAGGSRGEKVEKLAHHSTKIENTKSVYTDRPNFIVFSF
jgi:hypothetical protein